ncbi:unnamed protein product [Scytosiphon promiscuus]
MKLSGISLLLVAMILSVSQSACEAKRAAKDWSKMNLEDLEKQWEGGDDDEELRTEQQIKFEKLERRRKEAQANAGKFDPRSFASMDATEIGAFAAGQKDVAGPIMLFAQVGSGESREMKDVGSRDESVSKEETENIGSRFQQLAQLGSLDVSVYTIDSGSLLVSSQRGWEGKEILDFLLSRPEVSKVTWNSQDFFPPKDGVEEL